MELKFVEFYPENEQWITENEFIEFMKDAEIIVSNFGFAWTKDYINCVNEYHRGANLSFKDKTTTWAYNISGKYIKTKHDI